jgi:ornithine decarboxylase
MHPRAILCANPTNHVASIRLAKAKSVRLMMFDSLTELMKLSEYHPTAHAILRIHVDASERRIDLSHARGADMDDVPKLLESARSVGVDVVGVAIDSATPRNIEHAKFVARIFPNFGFAFRYLDVGDLDVSMAAECDAALETHFPDPSDVIMVAELGAAFFDAATFKFATVLGTRDDKIFVDACVSEITGVLRSPQNGDVPPAADRETMKTVLGTDLVPRHVMLPTLSPGDYVAYAGVHADGRSTIYI